MTDKEIFDRKVIPIMDKVANELKARQTEEYRKEAFSLRGILAGATGPDGGMAADTMAFNNLRITGEWNSKTVEDYVEMVKAELKRQDIAVTPEIEKMMIDKMVKDKMPKSSIEYILRKAANNSVFSIGEQALKSPLQKEIEARGESLYNPSNLEKGIGWGLGAATDFVAMGGTSLVSGLGYVGSDIAINSFAEHMEKGQETVQANAGKEEHSSDVHIPLVLLPGQEQAWLDEQQKKKTQVNPQSENEGKEKEDQSAALHETSSSASDSGETKDEAKAVQQENQPAQDNTNGWQNILSGLGLSGISDIGRNAGYILAMLPDMILGMFTGKTQSLGLKDNMIPIASIIAGMFVKNPLLKMTLIGLGGANLINKAGHEQLAKQSGQTTNESQSRQIYMTYREEEQNSRIRDTQIHGTTMIATIDNIPVTINLPEKVVDAYRQGALPMSNLANAVLERCDRMQQLSQAQERFEQESQTTTRTISQR